jgi:hypothetical protein
MRDSFNENVGVAKGQHVTAGNEAPQPRRVRSGFVKHQRLKCAGSGPLKELFE